MSDNIAFGTAPALIIFLWSLQYAPRFGWIAALALAVCCALRLARFNARIDAAEQPHKSAGFNTGVPAPVGAGLAFVPLYLWLISGDRLFQDWRLVMPWTLFIALLMISSVPTYTWGSIRIRRGWRIFALAGVALFGAALLNEPWLTLLAISVDLSRDAAVQHGELCQGQAAARCRWLSRARTGWKRWWRSADGAGGEHRRDALALQGGEDPARRLCSSNAAPTTASIQRVARKTRVASAAIIEAIPCLSAEPARTCFVPYRVQNALEWLNVRCFVLRLSSACRRVAAKPLN